MKKLFPLAVVLASVALSSSSAMAAVPAYKVAIISGPNYVPVGTWHLEVAEEDYSPLSYQAVCRYFVDWTNDLFLKSSAVFRLDEHQTPDYFDCLENLFTPFQTMVFLGPGLNKGFDRWQQKQVITYLAGGENGYDGHIDAVIQFNGGSLFGLFAEAC